MPMMRIGIPATYAMAKPTGMSVTAVPEVRLPRDEQERDGGERARDGEVLARDRAAPAFAEELRRARARAPPSRTRTAAG